MSGFTAGQTIRVKGEGGSVYDQDVPTDGPRRELLDEFIATAKLEVLGLVVDGELVDIPDAAPDTPPVDDDDQGDEPAGDVPDGTIEEILTWVDNDVERARAAFAAEQAGKQRATLIAALAETLES